MDNPTVITLNLGMVKAFLIQDRQKVLIDTGMPGQLDKLLAEFRKNKVEPQEISLIICTHSHTDHVGELADLQKLTGARVVLHRSEADGLSRGETSAAIPRSLLGKWIIRMMRFPPVQPVQTDVLVDEELPLETFGVDGRIIHTPGHTPGSLSIVLANGDWIVGDLLTGKKSGPYGKAVLPFFASDLADLKKSLAKINSQAPRRIYNAHGTPITAQAVADLIARLSG